MNAVTRGEQVKIPAETLITFKLQSPINVTTSRVGKRAGGRDLRRERRQPESAAVSDPEAVILVADGAAARVGGLSHRVKRA